MKTFVLPDLGEGLHEAQIVEWHVSVGDSVVEDDVIVSVETDKAVTEVPAPWSGRISRLCAEVGGIIKVGEAIVEYAGDDDSHVAQPEARSADMLETVAGAEIRAAAPSGTPVSVMPAVRLLAAELDITLDSVTGTGPDGAILARDIVQAAKNRAVSNNVPADAEPGTPGAAMDAVDWEPLIGPRRTMARNMAQAHAEIVPATVHEEADIGKWPSDQDMTVRLVRALLAGVAAEPALNCWFDAQKGRRVHQTVDVGIAVDALAGLFVPILRGAQNLTQREIRSELDRIISGARKRSLSAGEFKGATITLSNYGSIAGLHATPVVVPPQVAILGAGRSREQVLAGENGPVVSRVLPLSLTYDHRAVTGGEAARFIRAVVLDLTQAN